MEFLHVYNLLRVQNPTAIIITGFEKDPRLVLRYPLDGQSA